MAKSENPSNRPWLPNNRARQITIGYGAYTLGQVWFVIILRIYIGKFFLRQQARISRRPTYKAATKTKTIVIQKLQRVRHIGDCIDLRCSSASHRPAVAPNAFRLRDLVSNIVSPCFNNSRQWCGRRCCGCYWKRHVGLA